MPESLKGQYDPSKDRLRFTDAAAYLEYRGVAAAAGTMRLEKERLRALKKLLAQIAGADLKLKDFTDIRLVRNYQQKRVGEGVGPRTVNMEGQLLRSILKHHEQWKLDGKYDHCRSLLPRQDAA